MASIPPTSVDVARRAGVSQPTVSRSFDPKASVAPETRSHVLAVARELGYKPNALARSLSTRQSMIIGIIMANVTNSHFYPAVLEKLTQQLQAMGRQVLLFTVPPEQNVDELLPRMLAYRVDGLVIASSTPSNEIANEFARIGTPVVLFNRYVPGLNASAVCCDNAAGGRIVADLLLDAGHRRPAFIAGIRATATNTQREEGFHGRLLERNQVEWLYEQGNYTYESGHEAALRLLQRSDPPDAIFCAADIMALGALDAARFKLGLSVPEDVSIVGFDDISAAAWPAYDLTTIRQPIDEMLTATLELLIPSSDSPPATNNLRLLPGELVVRGSTRLAH